MKLVSITKATDGKHKYTAIFDVDGKSTDSLVEQPIKSVMENTVTNNKNLVFIINCF